MIGMTTSSVVNDMEFRTVHYSKDIEKHAIMFKYLGGEINILLDRAEFGNFMRQVVDSYCEDVKALADGIKKEKTK
jgi:hypothetical protein